MHFSKLFIVVAVLILISCQVQKRRYQKGYYVKHSMKSSALKNSKHSVAQNGLKVQSKNSEQIVLQNSGDFPVIAGVEKPKSITNNAKTFYTKAPAPDSCDILVFKDGSEIRANVLEVIPTEVKYKRCDNIEGPSYLTNKKDLFMIKFRNGTREVIKDEPELNYQAKQVPKYASLKQKNVIHPMAPLALISGILSILVPYVSLFLSFFLSSFPPFMFVVMFLVAIAAIAFGRTALVQIKEQPDVYRGKGLAMPGMIMGIVMLTILITVTIAILLL